MTKGTVKWFDCKKGFGFVVNSDGKDVFVHYTSIDLDGFRCLREGQTVEYKELKSDKGLQGKEVKILEYQPNATETKDGNSKKSAVERM